MFLYRNIIKESFKITWCNKYLWFFGLFAALLGNGYEHEVFVKIFSGNTEQSYFPGLSSLVETGIFSTGTFSNIGRLFIEEPFTLLMVLLVGLIIMSLLAFLVWITIVSQVALVNNVAEIRARKKNNFQGGISAGARHFLPVLGLNVVLKLGIGLLFALLGLPLVLSINRSSLLTANIMYGILFIVFIPLAIAVSFVVKYAIAYIVIRGVNFFEAIKSGWQLFIKNWLVSLEMALLLFFINFSIGLILIFFFLILAVPLLFLAFLFKQLALLAGLWLIVVLAFIIFFVLLAVVGASLATFQISAWTNLFIELTGKGGVSKVVRIMSKLHK